ncbi:MAG: GAF domain-containing protein [Prevotella sp.]|nr:GAF domain-containing protein [Prevotella sp.]
MNKQEQYAGLAVQLQSLISGETDETAVMANAAALIHRTFDFWWTGFYRVVNGELLLGAFQGPVACYHIRRGRGVCGTAWERRATIVVPDVEQFPGHIACSTESKSEIVVPLADANGDIRAVLDIDSRELGTFDETDREQLERICQLIAKTIY